MKIQQINNFSSTFSFGINVQSPKLKFKEDDFYVRIKGYGHHSGWAKKIIETADRTVNYIRQLCNFEETLKKVANGVRDANQLLTEQDKREHSGILRKKRNGWLYGSSWGPDLITRYSTDKRAKYSIYADRLDYTVKHPLKNPFRNFALSRPKHDADIGKYIDHGSAKYINDTFEQIDGVYNYLYQKYIKNEAKEDSLEEINDLIAQMRWILAHATPWERGSDAISNTFIRSVYKSMGIKTYPLKKGVSLDLEAYCTNLEEYKKNFPYYFTKQPKIIV